MTDILYSVALGFVAGLIPVYLGLLPLPLFRRLSASKRNLLLSFSIGILLFLFADVTGEGVELSKQASYGSFLFAVGLIVGVIVPFLVSSRRRHISDSSAIPDIVAKSVTAYIISFAIGLHNLGEGLALGAAYAAGQFALTTTLVVGFALHNGTEGIAISGPVSDIPVRARAPVSDGISCWISNYNRKRDRLIVLFGFSRGPLLLNSCWCTALCRCRTSEKSAPFMEHVCRSLSRDSSDVLHRLPAKYLNNFLLVLT